MCSWKQLITRFSVGTAVIAGVGFGTLQAYGSTQTPTAAAAFCDPDACRRGCSDIYGPNAGGSCIDGACVCHPN